MFNFIKNLFKMPVATYKCSTVWTVFLSTLFLSSGFTILATQINTKKDVFVTTETQDSTIGNVSIKATSGANNNGFISTEFKVFTYDASAISGSRFTEITDYGAIETLSGDAGDRLYIGTRFRSFSFCATATQAKSNEKYIVKYKSDGAGDLVSVPFMSMKDPNVEPTNKSLFENIGFNYLTINKKVELDWGGSTGELDKYPVTTFSHFWMVIEVPVGGIITPAKIRDFAWRGSGQSQTEPHNADIYWGTSRILQNIEIMTDDFTNGSIPTLAILDITSTQNQSVHQFRNGQNDAIKYRWALPQGIDTSSPLDINFVYTANTAINTADIRLDLKVNGMGDALDNLQISDLNQTTNINVAGGDVQNAVNLVTDFDISPFIEDNIVYIELQRTDTNGGNLYPLELCISFYRFKDSK